MDAVVQDDLPLANRVCAFHLVASRVVYIVQSSIDRIKLATRDLSLPVWGHK